MNSLPVNDTVFTQTAPYYDLIYGYRNTKREASVVTKHLRLLLHNQKHPSLIDLGCGTGTYTIEFWRQGFDVTGLDRSAPMIAVAKTKAHETNAPIPFITANILSYISPRRYHAATSLFDVLSYMTTSEQVRKYFSTISSILHRNGIFIFDCWYGPGVFLLKPQVVRRRYKYGALTVLRVKTPSISYHKNTVSVLHKLSVSSSKLQKLVLRETHTLRYFFYPEIVDFASQAGFRILSWGKLAYPMHTPKSSPWSVCFIMKKTG